MIVTEMYNGQGLGNQLWCYVVTRVIAKDRKFNYGIKSPHKFKGKDFFDIDFGQQVVGGFGPEGGPPWLLPFGISHYYVEKKIVHPKTQADIRMHDKNLERIPDRTKIDGYMQDELYILHRRKEIRQWLRVKKSFECYDYSTDDICIMNFRGGEYVGRKNVFLTEKYWNDAMKQMRKLNMKFKFVVITEDVMTAKKFFPKLEVFHFDIAKDYVVIKNAKYLILSNSSFAWFPAWLSEKLRFCIAPKYWAQHNVSDGYWGLGYNLTSGWHYLDRQGKLSDYKTNLKELREYIKKHKSLYA